MQTKQNNLLLAEFEYSPAQVARGYTNQTLYVNLSDNTIAARPVSDTMKDIFIGGRGFGLWLLWQGIEDDTQWDDPENELIISSGPIRGITQYPASGKSLVVSISPTTQSVVDSNVGGYFGPYLKFAGWDAIEVQGKAEEEVIVFVDGVAGKVSIFKAPFDTVDTHILAEQLLEMFAETEAEKRSISSVTAGSGADHTLIGCLNVSLYDTRRRHVRVKQAGRGGTDANSADDLIRMSEAAYNFQRVFNLRLGFGTREYDAIPYRSAGPVTVAEYESRQERYDKQLREEVGFDPTGKSTAEKMAVLRKYREEQYEQLIDAVYNRRGWSANGIPTLETLQRLQIDFPDVVRVVQNADGKEA